MPQEGAGGRDAHTDGRVARRLRTREAILDALVALLLEGELQPGLKRIADRAGVTQRTLFNHFPELETALAAALQRSREASLALLPELPDEGTPDERVRAFFNRAAGFLDHYSALRWAALSQPRGVPGFDGRQGHGLVLAQLCERIDALAQGCGVDVQHDPQLEAAVRVVTDPLGWRLLRVQQGLSRARASEAMAHGLSALLRDARRARDLRAS